MIDAKKYKPRAFGGNNESKTCILFCICEYGTKFVTTGYYSHCEDGDGNWITNSDYMYPFEVVFWQYPPDWPDD